jgi:phage baseplate assembly protein W
MPNLPLLTFSWPFRSLRGEIPAQVTEEEAINESIRRLLLTPKGRRVMRNRVGTNAMRYIFENNDPSLEDALRFEALQALAEERRIVVTSVDTFRRDSELTVHINYVVRATGAQSVAQVSLGVATSA